jgi:ribosomal protein S18 acetylase RimI-like enzyme
MTEPTAPGPPLRVVPVDETNWTLYREVRLDALKGAPRAYWTTYADAAGRSDEEWRQLVTQPPERSRTWLALRERRPVGTVGAFRLPDQPPDECILVGMWVDPGARGLGVGELLVGTVVEAASQQGMRRVVLEVAHENGPAVALYERLGFVPTGRTGAMPHDPSITEFEMELVLSEVPVGSR